MKPNLQPENLISAELVDWPIAVDRILYEAEQPIVFVSHTVDGQSLLVYLAHETEEGTDYILASASESKIKLLEQGSVGVREALCSDWMWFLRHEYMAETTLLWSVTESEIPSEYMPVPETPLLPEHAVVFSARALGDGIELGKMPCSVISLVAESARGALKSVLDYVREANTEGRPTDAQRALYDLPVRRLRFASFEVGLSEPVGDLSSAESLQIAIDHLENGLTWAISDSNQDDSLGTSLAEREAVLRATLSLTPPSSGVVSGIEVSGAWLKGERFYLDRNSRVKVNRCLRSMKSEKIVVYSGRVGEIDDDNLSFILREASDGVDHKGTFSDELLDDMRMHYYESNRIQLSGVELNGRLRITAVVPLFQPKDA